SRGTAAVPARPGAGLRAVHPVHAGDAGAAAVHPDAAARPVPVAAVTMTPLPYRVTDRRQETADTTTLTVEATGRATVPPLPGQFNMVYAFGVGEVPISVSGRSGSAGLVHTLRAVGAVTRALHDVQVGQVLGVRGPFGTDWGLPLRAGSDLVVVAGGIGLA